MGLGTWRYNVKIPADIDLLSSVTHSVRLWTGPAGIWTLHLQVTSPRMGLGTWRYKVQVPADIDLLSSVTHSVRLWTGPAGIWTLHLQVPSPRMGLGTWRYNVQIPADIDLLSSVAHSVWLWTGPAEIWTLHLQITSPRMATVKSCDNTLFIYLFIETYLYRVDIISSQAIFHMCPVDILLYKNKQSII